MKVTVSLNNERQIMIDALIWHYRGRLMQGLDLDTPSPQDFADIIRQFVSWAVYTYEHGSGCPTEAIDRAYKVMDELGPMYTE